MVDLARNNPTYNDLIDVEYPLWFSLTLISFFAILFLPRQFHVMVVENCEEKHLKKAMWLFPLYLLLINLFVPAIAWGGLLLNTGGLKDAFIITIPYTHNQDLLSLFVFIGGTSAATAMILIESVAVGTMLLNDLELPYILRRIKKERNLADTLLNTRRLTDLFWWCSWGTSTHALLLTRSWRKLVSSLFWQPVSCGLLPWEACTGREVTVKCHGRAGVGLFAVDLHSPDSYSCRRWWRTGKFGQGWTPGHCLPQAH